MIENRLEQALGIPFTDGNSVAALRNGVEIFPAMLEAIEGARETIEFLTFIYWSGNIAERFSQALADRARSGVGVRVLLDSFGAAQMPGHLVSRMMSAGVDVRWFRPFNARKFWTWNNRTHRKILVCDGTIGFTGGVGIAEEWEGDARDPSEWRDTHFRFTGSAVAGLRSAFWSNWLEATGAIPMDLLDAQAERSAATAVAPASEETGRARVQIVRSTASIGWNDTATVLRTLIASAERRIVIATAYLAPDRELTLRLAEAVARGVSVTLLFPGPHADLRISRLASAAQIEALLDADVEIWRFMPTMLHCKLVLVDDDVTCVGSANLNLRSLRKDDEVTAVVVDRQLADEVADHFRADLDRAKRMTPEGFANRGLGRRLLERLSHVVKPET